MCNYKEETANNEIYAEHAALSTNGHKTRRTAVQLTEEPCTPVTMSAPIVAEKKKVCALGTPHV